MEIRNYFKKKKLKRVPIQQIYHAEYLFYCNHIKPGCTTFDIGANYGEFTLLFSRLTGETGNVHVFEPVPETYNRLLETVDKFKLRNAICNQTGISDTNGTFVMNVYDTEFNKLNTIANRPLEKYGIHTEKPIRKEISCTSIDDYCKNNNIDHIDLLKIDVEGAELKALEGARQMFLDKKIKCCVFEFGQTVFDMNNSVNDYINFFNSVNYKVSNIFSNQTKYPVNKAQTKAYFSIHSAIPK